jgi:hypothetical protein
MGWKGNMRREFGGRDGDIRMRDIRRSVEAGGRNRRFGCGNYEGRGMRGQSDGQRLREKGRNMKRKGRSNEKADYWIMAW